MIPGSVHHVTMAKMKALSGESNEEEENVQ